MAGVNNKQQLLHWTLATGASNPDYSFLPVLVEGSQQDGGSRLITLGTAGLREARRIINEGTELLGKLSQQALVSGNLPTAARLADEALRRDPYDEKAASVKRQLDKLQKAEATVASQSDPLNVKEFSNEQAVPPSPGTPAPRPQPPAAAPEPERDPVNDGEGRLLQNIEQNNRLMTDLIRTEVESTLREARARMGSDPASIEDSLKVMLGRVVHSPELKAEVRAQMRRQLEAALREASRRASTADILRQQNEVARAAAVDRLQISNELIRKEEKLVQLMDRFNSLMAEGRYVAADEIGEMEVGRLAPDSPIAQSATLTAHMTGARQADLALRMARQKAVVDTLGTVEVALMPFPDDQPVVYPPADEWQELTVRRKKYAATDLKTVSPIEKKIREALESPTRMEFVEMPLQDAISYLKDYHSIEIQLDTRALEDAGIGSDTPVTRTVNGISLRSALRMLLRELDLTYVIKDEMLWITTVDQAETPEMMVQKVYPVADLVIPVQSMGMGGGMMGGGMMGGMGGGMGGGMMGGMGGGMGGGMMGGMGGMGGGMGGGMFSVLDALPSTPTGFQAFAVPEDLKLGPKSKSPTTNSTGRPAGNQPARLRVAPPATKPAGKPVAIELAIPAGTHPEAAWSTYFAAHPKVSDASVKETVRQLMHGRKFGEVVGLTSAALRSGHPQPWMYEAMALAMQAGGSSQKDIERALMSAVDFGQTSDELMYVAQYMARSGLPARALKVFHQIAQIEPLRPEPYLYGLQLAERLHDMEGIRWASLGILKRAWPKDKSAIVDQATHAAAAAVEELKNSNQLDEAARLQAEIDQAKIRDCIVKITWTGDADVDIIVEEPSGARLQLFVAAHQRRGRVDR